MKFIELTEDGCETKVLINVAAIEFVTKHGDKQDKTCVWFYQPEDHYIIVKEVYEYVKPLLQD
jgi:hypothetical protein